VGVAALPLSWWVLIINNGPGSPSRPCLAGRNSSVGICTAKLCLLLRPQMDLESRSLRTAEDIAIERIARVWRVGEGGRIGCC
jgi:hypothetical protein